MALSNYESKLSTAKTVFTTVASVAGTLVVARSIAREYMPYEIQDYLFTGFRRFLNKFSNQLTMVFDELDGYNNNQIYDSAATYLGNKISPSVQRIKVTKHEKEHNYSVTVDREEEIVDVFDGVKLKWVLMCQSVDLNDSHNHHHRSNTVENRSYELSFPKKYKQMVLTTYLPYVLKEAKTLKEENKTIKLFTLDPDNMYGNMSDAWQSVNLDHPANFSTLALDSEVKNTILQDLQRFVKRKDYYKKVGKAWKRGYLLYGPPGTGKSSLIAAMANYLNFNIYDLELTEIKSNSQLRRLLVSTANRSIIVVEDIDCTIEFHDRLSQSKTSNPEDSPQENHVTLSGFLNFSDGLWSSCGDERIIVFTTNHKDKLDPAMLRPGRMDVHIHMSYCSPSGFKLLAANYLGIKEHALLREIDDQIVQAEVSPAEVAEQLMRSDEPDVALSDLLEFLKLKLKASEEAKALKREEESRIQDVEVQKIDDGDKKISS